jgi:hypothetical protein
LLPFLPSFSLKKKALEKTLLKKEEKKKATRRMLIQVARHKASRPMPIQ